MFLYKQYDHDGLDRQFNNRLHVPDYADYFDRWERLSREAQQKFECVKDVPYGHLLRERLDVFPSALPQSKTLVFIHGGYWQMLDKSMFNFIANGFHEYAVTTVMITYPLAPGASFDQIVSSVRKAVGWIYENVSAFNGDPNQIYVAGHSAGGHLAAMLMATDWKLINASLPEDLIKGTSVISGLFNLTPVRLSYLNEVLQMDEQASLRNSPVMLHPINISPLIIAVGSAETAEFNDQSKELYEAWKYKGLDVQFLQLPQFNHFSIVEALAESETALHQSLKEMMSL
ncbi:alpha/beta hydrolase [Segetibacter aerophilus]|uniref:Esterase n=1 Tax=Segetibacter aerophilus TaxID=670293 RepID=A0A512BDT0_9BACT|nr:alpha/beta hydrolase [Segetibacter aerophilus]GEO10017.1 esterase [Segetibacter aerophilus]